MPANKEIDKVLIHGTSNTCLVIPKKVALEYGLEEPANVVVEKTDQGILIRKLEI
jgi:bifunctional DNA-binding transcriptional regulator/antitoxin component of YhaV-PrlF toxin-antitoxin module